MDATGGLWLNSSFSWKPTDLEASPAKVVQPRKVAGAPVCQVEGCGVDLSGLRYFFRKQHICEQHARADAVTDSAGRQLRFCQQCTRLEPITNFNAGRRSCKMSLAKRQARAHRVKTHSSPDSSPERAAARASGRGSSSSGGEGASSLNVSSGKGSSRRSGGGGLSSKRSRGSPSANGVVSPGVAAMANNGKAGLHSPPCHPTMPPPQQPGGTAVAGQPGLRPLPPQRGPEGMLWSSSLFENDIEELLALDPDALADSLLVPAILHNHKIKPASGSSGATQTPAAPTAGTASPATASGTPLPSSQPLAMEQPWGGMGAAMVSTAAPQARAGAAPTFGATPSAVGTALFGPSPAVPALPGGLWPSMAAATAAAAGPGPQPAVAPAQPPSQAQPTEWAAQLEAMQVTAMQQQASGVATAVQQMYPLHIITRFSLKIFGVKPDHLPPQLRAELLAALQVSPTVLEGTIRCGCTHVVVDVLLSGEERQQLATAPCLAAALQHMRRPDSWRSRPSPPAIVAQLGPLVALGTAASSSDSGGEAGDVLLPCIHMGTSQLLPRLELVGPLATIAGTSRGRFILAAVSTLANATHLRCGLAAALKCCCHGRHVGLAVSALHASGHRSDESEGGDSEALAPPMSTATEPGMTVLEVWAPEAANGDGWGLYEFEISSGSLLSEPVPVLVLPDEHADAAAELCQLQEPSVEYAPGASAASTLRLVAMVLRYLQLRQVAAAAGAGTAAGAAFRDAYPPPATTKLAAVAQRLVVLAVRARWPALVRLLLPAIAADGSSTGTAMRRLDALSAPAPSLVHLAVASGTAASLAALRSWTGSEGASWGREGAPWMRVQSGPPPPWSLDLLLLAAAMGGSLDEQMVQQLMELMGQERFVQAADLRSPSGWSPRSVAAATGNATLLAALPVAADPAPVPTVQPAVVQEAEAGFSSSEQGEEQQEAGGERLEGEQVQQKLKALQQDWPASHASSACKPCVAFAAAAHSKVHSAGVMGSKAPWRKKQQPSHDAMLLTSLLREMHVPSEPATACHGSGSEHGCWAVVGAAAHDGCPIYAGCRFLRITSHLLATSVAGVMVAVVAALAAVVVLMAS